MDPQKNFLRFENNLLRALLKAGYWMSKTRVMQLSPHTPTTNFAALNRLLAKREVTQDIMGFYKATARLDWRDRIMLRGATLERQNEIRRALGIA